MSNLVKHAEFELKRTGLFDEDSDYGGALGPHVVEMVKKFAEGGHSGGSAAIATAILTKLLSYKVLTPLTSAPEEWNEVPENCRGKTPLWQSRRQPSTFSVDAGKTWYDLDELDAANRDKLRRRERAERIVSKVLGLGGVQEILIGQIEEALK
jgi:hypothetical protein